MKAETLPDSHADLLENPNFAHLATVRPDGSPQTNVMWFGWDGQRVRFTHATTRQKFRNLSHERRVSMSIADPTNPYRYLEVRGEVESIVPDDENTSFFRDLKARYGRDDEPIVDADVRIVITVRPTLFIPFDGRMTEADRGWR